MCWKVLTVLLLMATLNEASKILVMFPMCAKSHNILGTGVVRNLLEAGHEVTQVTCYPTKKPVKNFTEIDISSFEKKFYQDEDQKELFKLKNLVGKNNFADSIFFMYMTHYINKEIIRHETVVDFLSDTKNQFDAVILEWFFADMVAGIAPLFQCPLIWFGTTEAHWQVLRLVDDIPNPSYNVDLFSTNETPLTFWERVRELWTLVKKSVVLHCVVIPFEKYFYNSFFPPIAAKRGVTMPSYNEAVFNSSLLFLNSHPSLGTPFRLPQMAKYVGGYHIDPKIDALPKDLQKIMDDAKDGVIYFSMGSNLRSVDMSEQMKDSLLQMFSKLKQTVIWKFEEGRENVPINVHLVKWAPQTSILAHPNIRIFITHGGQLSTTEAIHFGVPVIGIPVFGDQYVNMRSAVVKGFGIEVKLADNMADNLNIAIRNIIEDPKYMNKAKDLSSNYHDRPIPPGKEIVHWVEHVIRTQGASHLRSPALDVPCYQKAYLDLISIVFVILFFIYKIFKRLRNNKNVSSNKNQVKKAKKHN